jgi:hypothetical protein
MLFMGMPEQRWAGGFSLPSISPQFTATRSLNRRGRRQKKFSAESSPQSIENARFAVRDGRKWKVFLAPNRLENAFRTRARRVLEVPPTVAAAPAPHCPAGRRVAGKWCRNPLESLDSRREMVWPRKSGTHKVLGPDEPSGRACSRERRARPTRSATASTGPLTR